MLRKNEKAQGLVEFALILPLLLLLLVGVVEAARIIWAYTTVQTAAREATRYAISGKPYAGSPTSDACTNPAGDPNASAPWVCNPISRTVAIENVAINRVTSSINFSTPCRSLNFNQCRNVPNAFAVQVVGQVVLTSTGEITTALGNAGDQGLNVKVSSYYNLQMIDPIFDTIMGHRTIEIRAELSMQNEGIEKALGGAPPPAINNTTNFTTTGGSGTGLNGERIWALNSPVEQGNSLSVHLDSHFNLAGPYDIFLSLDGTLDGNSDYLICSNVNTPPSTNSDDFSCPISGSIPPGTYKLYSTLAGSYSIVAKAEEDVEIKSASAPKIEVDNGAGSNTAAINSFVTIKLIAHQKPDEPFDLYVVYGSGPTVQQIMVNKPFDFVGPWRIPDLGTPNPCPAGGSIPCFIESRRTSSPTATYGRGEFYISQPEIVLSGGNMNYAQGETMHVFLRGHTPGLQYDLKISNGTGSVACWVGRTPVVGANGSTTTPVNWDVPATTVSSCNGVNLTGMSDGNYTITSHPSSGGTPRSLGSMDTTNQVAQLNNVQINTPNGPFLTIDGGYNWPAGSVINIKANKHTPANNPYYFKFGPWRVPIAGATPTNTFNTGSGQSYVTSYQIPLTATIGVAATIPVSSFINAGNVFVTSRNVTVSPVPVIMVLQGSTVTPDTIITIQITNHAPNSSYQIYYNNQLLGEILTDATGQGQLSYDLKQLPTDVPPGNPNSYGTPYPVTSRYQLTGATVATTQLTLRPADLRVASIQLPPNPILNTSVPVTFTIQNTSSVTITRYFDTDIYFDPSPMVPAYQQGTFNFPGDFKDWRNSLAPGASFTLVKPFFVGSYGPHKLYSYADTSNQIVNENSETNNILSNTLTISCTPTFITDPFTTISSDWTTQLYGNAENNGTAPQIVNPSGSVKFLRLTSDGSNTALSDDNALTPPRGYTLYRQSSPIDTTTGLDVRVQVLDAPGNPGSKAGLEVRDTVNPTSPKLEFGLTLIGSTYQLQAVFRDSVSPTPVIVNVGSIAAPTSSSPVWLRIQRYGGTNTFLFYAVQSASTSPAWGAPLYSATIGLSEQLEFGLFMNSAGNGNHQTADFDNFVYGNPNSCPSAQGQPPIDNTPPGLVSCTDPLTQKSFENPSSPVWKLAGQEGVQFSGGSAHTGNWKLLAPTYDGQFHNPSFYQSFVMPSFVISSTTNFNLSLFKNVDPTVDGEDANDRFYAIITTGPTLSSTWVTDPIQVTDGFWGKTYSPVDWRSVNILQWQPATGVNLETYAGQTLYLHFYNNSNSSCVGLINCHASKFYFDDISLSPCTTKPLPTTITTRITGDVVVHQASAGDLRIAGVKVWAYAEGGQLYETVTIQNGEFNFYNLPATIKGIKYFIYAEYTIVNPANPSIIDTFAANTTVLLTNANTDANPVKKRLDLY